MLLEKNGVLEKSDLPQVLKLMRNHSVEEIAEILSARKGPMTDLDVLMFLRNCIAFLMVRVEEYKRSGNDHDAEVVTEAIKDFFPLYLMEVVEVQLD